MKKVVGMLGFTLISGLISFVPANAGECSPQDPCMTYAEVDASGKVVNTIVCQPSVCRDEWGGSHPGNGNKLVPQVAADSNGQHTFGILGDNKNTVVTESNGTFTVNNDSAKSTTISNTVEVSSSTENNSNTTVQTTVVIETTSTVETSNGGKRSFTFNDTLNAQNGEINYTKTVYETNTSATVSATSATVSTSIVSSTDNSNKTVSQSVSKGASVSKSFDNKVSEHEFENTMTDNFLWNWSELNLIFEFWNFWTQFLDDWFLELDGLFVTE